MLLATPRWERVLTLAPVIVVGIGIVAAVLILLVRAFADSLRDVRNKRLLALAGVVLLLVVVVLTYLGVKLPKE